MHTFLGHVNSPLWSVDVGVWQLLVISSESLGFKCLVSLFLSGYHFPRYLTSVSAAFS